MDLIRPTSEEPISEQNTETFYRDLPGFSDFARLGESQHFKTAPRDWILVLTDVEGSTDAIAAGRYKDVNVVGAASIAAVRSVFENPDDVPYVFGGDGASFLIHHTAKAKTLEKLEDLQILAKANFGLKLRVAFVPVADIYAEGQILEVAKFNVAHTKTISFIRGGGLTWAEGYVKMFPRKYTLRTKIRSDLSEMQKLSCRWQPVPSQKGKVLSILIQARHLESSQLFSRILLGLDEIFGGSIESANPIAPEALSYYGVISLIRAERRLHSKLLSGAFAKRVFWIVVAVAIFKWKIIKSPALTEYFHSMSRHSDFRKFDDVLRLTLDVSREQAAKLDAYLHGLHLAGDIYYGVHASSHALMTCLVESLAPGQHIHFVDGADGGYAAASAHMKSQINKRP